MWVLEISHETTVKKIWDVSRVDLKQNSTSISHECSKLSTESSCKSCQRWHKARYDPVRRSSVEQTFHAKNTACMNELWKVVLIRHGIPGIIGNYWGGEIDRWTTQEGSYGLRFTAFIALPESSGSRFIPLGWDNSAWASEVRVTRPTVGRNLQTEDWRPWADSVMMMMAILKAPPHATCQQCYEFYAPKLIYSHKTTSLGTAVSIHG